MMRSLVISHTYVAPDNHAKWECLARSGAAEIELHLPHRWPSWEADYQPSPVQAGRFQIRVAHALRTGREDQYFFAPRLFRGMRDGNFDILHVEQGSAAFVYFQALIERNRVSPRTRTCFFTWINWESPMRWPWTAAERYNLRHSQGAIGGNGEAVDLLKKHGFQGKTAVIPQLGVDPSAYSPAPNPGLRQRLGLQGVTIGFVGRLVPEKGVSLLIDAVQRLTTETSLLLVGSGPLAAEIQRSFAPANNSTASIPDGGMAHLAYQLGKHSRLVHVPAVAHHEVRDYLQAMDVLVLPSFATPRWKEQFGHALIEAMACEIPVIGSSSGAIPEVIGDAGMVFKERNADDLFHHLEALVVSADQRRSLGQRGRQRVLRCYTHQEIARQTLEFWTTLCAS